MPWIVALSQHALVVDLINSGNVAVQQQDCWMQISEGIVKCHLVIANHSHTTFIRLAADGQITFQCLVRICTHHCWCAEMYLTLTTKVKQGGL